MSRLGEDAATENSLVPFKEKYRKISSLEKLESRVFRLLPCGRGLASTAESSIWVVDSAVDPRSSAALGRDQYRTCCCFYW